MKNKISDAESRIMNLLWDQNPLSAAQIIERLPTDLDWQDKTVKTLLNRLLKKEFLVHEKVGRYYMYRPAIDRESYLSQENRQFLDRFYGGQLSPLIASFATEQTLSDEDIKALRQLVAQMEDSDND